MTTTAVPAGPTRSARAGAVDLAGRSRWFLSTFGPALAIVVAQQILFPSTGSDGSYQWGLVVQGITIGLLSALVALGMALIYRANRILNFAQGDLGLVPVSFAVALILFSGMNYFLAFGLGLVASVVVGAVVELAIIRRFFRSPRLILTVATIGLAQLLAFAALALPRLWGEQPVQSRLNIPIDWQTELAPFIFDADYVVAWIIPPIAMVAVALFLRFTSVGIAIRASAERADRASLLGIPVGRLHTYVWTIACVLSFLALFLRAGVSGLPLAVPTDTGLSVGLTVLLSALAALMLGRLTNLPAIVASAIALGLLEAHVSWNDVLIIGPFELDLGSDTVVSAVLAVVILVTLLVQRTGVTRAESDETSSWQTADEVRPIPRELRHLRDVRLVKGGLLLGVAALLVALPHLPAVGTPGNTSKAAGVIIFALVIMSITVLTGWAGQVSLGQMGFVAIGAALGAKSAVDWGLDLALALPLIGMVGAGVAVLIGLPALRLRGLYLAVVTLAFAMATTRYLLNPTYFEWVPRDSFEPEPLLGTWDYAATEGQEGIYYLSLGVFLLTVVAILGIRRSRTGRVLVALRENERGVQAYGVSVVRAKLTAFALSGFVASVGGVLLVHLVEKYTMGLVPEADNLTVFTAAVVGGLGSLTGAVLGAVFLQGGEWFLQDEWRFLASALGVLLVLLLLPGGLSGAVFRGRDLLLRNLAVRRQIVVPSLLADTRELEETAEEAFEKRAEAMAAAEESEAAEAAAALAAEQDEPAVGAPVASSPVPSGGAS
jgi:branched-chain amino acid transport system permease protein